MTARAPTSPPVLVALTAAGLELARRLKPVLPGAVVHGLAGRVDGADETFADTVGHLRALFAAGRPIVGLCAAGILVRALAPAIGDKTAEPPVVAVAEDGSVAAPLLGGHRGANRLARAVADVTGGVAAVTAAGDVRLGLALDDPPPGWTVANPEAVKPIAAALLAGRPVSLCIEAGDAGWLTGSDARFASEGSLAVLVTDRAAAPSADTLILHPPTLALGVGCERGADPDELIALAGRTLADAGLAPASVACVVSLDLKADEPAVHALAGRLGVPARFFPAARLEAETPRLADPSEVVFREVGCHGVAEGAALAAVAPTGAPSLDGARGARDVPHGALIVPKRTSARATCAVARAAPGADLDAHAIGHPQGRLMIVGIGPGQAAWRTPEATRALQDASDAVGYGLYLDLIADAIAGKARHESALSEEETRVRTALDLAAEGRAVALVSSGDAGIYALAALAFELLDREDRAEWNRVAVSVVPGVSALQAAAARIGAPLGHDFCTISLSDLLTPWPTIERRLKAAAMGDFVVALYNPVSKRRREQLVRARDILLEHRPPATPVVLARNLGRAGETVDVIRLDALAPERVDMLTVVLIGSSQTRVIDRGARRWVYTPRGYSTKTETKKVKRG